jgi:hypothetical protein
MLNLLFRYPQNSGPRALRGWLLCAFLLASVFSALAQTASPHTTAPVVQVVGEITLTIGKSSIERADGPTEPQKGGSIREGDVIRTSDSGHVHIKFIDGARVSVRPNSVFRIHEFKYTPTDPAASVVRLSLDSGEARSISGAAAQAAKERFRLNTPLVAIGVKGTDFVTQVGKDVIRVTVNQGAIVMAPFDSACKPEALGVCASSRARELTAEMLGQALIYRLGAADPSFQSMGKPGQSDASRLMLLDRQVREGTEKPLASETEVKNPLNAVAPNKLIWGRWAREAMPSDALTVPFIDALKGNEITVGDGYYFLFRQPAQVNVLPNLSTKVDFSLQSSSAYYRNAGNEIMPATVQSGTLGVDFGNKTFSTTLSMSAQGVANHTFSQSGALNANTGIFLGSASGASNASGASGPSLAGALGLDARQAGYFFRSPAGAGSFSGATLWGR